MVLWSLFFPSLIWLRIRTGGVHLWVQQWTFGFHKMCGISWLGEELLVSQERLCSFKLWSDEFFHCGVTHNLWWEQREMCKVKHNTYTYVSGVQRGRVIHAVDIVTDHVFFFTFMGPCIVNIFKYNQHDATLHNGIYYYKCSACFRQFLRPSSGAQNCIHGLGYLSSFFCFLPLSWVSWNWISTHSR